MTNKKVTLAEMQDYELESFIFREFDKHERMKRFSELSNEFRTAKVYFKTFKRIWVSSENLHDDIAIVKRVLDSLIYRTYGKQFLMTKPERRTYDKKLAATGSESLLLYRGCGEHNKEGYSFTTSKAKAKFFSNRVTKGDAFVITYRVKDPSKVYFYANIRDEREFVCDPAGLEVIDIELQPATNRHKATEIFWLVQSGRLNREHPMETSFQFVKEGDIDMLQNYVRACEESMHQCQKYSCWDRADMYFKLLKQASKILKSRKKGSHAKVVNG